MMLYDNYKHSSSSGNLWMDNMSAFLWRYGFKKWGTDNPRTVMGRAAETAVYAALDKNWTPELAAESAEGVFESMLDGKINDADGVVFKECAASGAIAANMVKELQSWGGTFTRKPREARSLPGISKKVNLAADLYHSERGIVDLKATLRIAWAEDKDPDPSQGHVRQQGLYANMEGLPAGLLYATPKRTAYYQIPQEKLEMGARELFDAFEQIERWAEQFPTPEQAIRFIPLNVESFYWDDDEAVTDARKLWRQHSNKQAA